MYDFDLLFGKTLELFELFASSDFSSVVYDNKSQEIANQALTAIAQEIGVFDKTSEREEQNILSGLTIVDKETGERKSLIDIDSMKSRVESVLDSNDIHSCLKTLAVVNKCAHSLDKEIERLENSLSDMYRNIYRGEINKEEGKILFSKPIEDILPRVGKSRKDYLRKIRDVFYKEGKYLSCEEFKYLFDKLKKNTFIDTIKETWDYFGIEYKDNKEAMEKISFKDDGKTTVRRHLLDAYMFSMYNIGRALLTLQNNLFAIKSLYISMIAQLLKTDERFKGIEHELIHTKDGKEGFEYMLVINDPSLSYYIEVHMPNYVKKELVDTYGYTVIEEEERDTKALGASAVYRRDMGEVKELREALDKGLFPEELTEENGFAKRRAEVISRELNESSGSGTNNDGEDNGEDSSGGSDGGSDNGPDKGPDGIVPGSGTYKFQTRVIVDEEEKSYIKAFLKAYKINIYDDTIRFCDNLLHNENYPKSTLLTIVSNYYYNIYLSFNEKERSDFIDYVLFSNKKVYKTIDEKILDKLRQIYKYEEIEKYLGDNVEDIIASVLIYKDLIIDNYMKNMENDQIKDIDYYVEDFIINKYDKLYNNYNIDNYNKEKDNDQKRR